jgi:multidrug efflux system membrane fusion protein
VTMSTAGIQRGVPGTFVYLLTPDSTVTVRPVKLGVTDGDHVEVLSGVEPGDRIVIDGADKLREGATVVVRAEADPNNPGAVPKGGDKGGGKGAWKGGGDGDKSGGGQRKRRSDGEKRGEQTPTEQTPTESKQGEPKQ